MKRIFKHMFRRGQTGQTLVILAFGFIVLLGFVGIVTDVSLLFVRYSTLRRAVDSAAVAAAGQLRRVAPTAQDQADVADAASRGVTLTLDGVAYARNLATVNLAARQFVEFYGLSPSNVLVETCQTTDYKDAELCTSDQRKLVRVTAQVASPTVFLRLLGWGTVTLEASAISESAVLDVVLIMDVSESMTDTTTYADWEAVGKGARVLPPVLDKARDAWAADNPEKDPLEYLTSILSMNHPLVLQDTYLKNQMKAYVMNGGTPQVVDFSDSRLPRPTCQVRYYPEGWEIDADLLAEYRQPQLAPGFPAKAGNFVPQ
jgi:Flp pilus assembly protein TadG